MSSPLDPSTANTATERADRRHANRRQRHRFRSRVRAFWRKMNGYSDEPEELVEGMALTDAPAGQPLQVRQILGGCQRMRRLIEIGVYPRAKLEVVRACDSGPVIVKVGETRLAVGRNMARSVMVELTSDS